MVLQRPGEANEVAQLAETVLKASRPAGVTSPQDDVQLPAPLLELLEFFMEALQKPHSSSTKELVVRALRSCLHLADVTGRDQVLRGVLPFLLSHTSPALQLVAAGCVLLCCSTATTSTLRSQLPYITITISRTLTPIQSISQFSSSASPTILRLVSTTLRILSAIFAKVSPLPVDIITTVMPLLSAWIYHRPGVAGSASPAPDRGRPTMSGGALAFGVMGAFLPTSPQKKKRVDGGRSSSRSSMVEGGSSESEDDEAVKAERRNNAAQVRLDALACLRTIALNNAKALYPHWGLFLADSPYLRSRRTLLTLVESDPAIAVRLRACYVLVALLDGSMAYLAIAEDRPTKASFTSLSSKIGEVVSELHLKLASLVSSPASLSQSGLLAVLLGLVNTLVENAPYGRLERPLAQPLARAILPLICSEDDAIAGLACIALTSIARNVFGQPKPCPQLFDSVEVSAACIAVLQSSSSRPSIHADAWSLLAETAPRAENFDLTPALVVLHAGFETSSIATQEAQMAFIASLFKFHLHDSASPLLLQPYSLSFVRIVRVALKSLRPQLRVLGCGVLASPVLAELDAGSLPLYPFEEGLKLAEDEDASVRVAACRVLGLLVKSSLFVSNTSLLRSIIEALVRRCEDQEPVLASASWSLANCCDILTPKNSRAINTASLVHEALLLALPVNGEKVHTNGLRALGSLLKVSPSSTVVEDREAMARVVTTLCEGVRSGPAKVRWNAAAAIANALAGPALSSPSTEASVDLLHALSATLIDCRNFKVRIQAATGLMVPTQRSGYGTGEAFALVLARARQAREKASEEEASVPAKETAHLAQLKARLDKCSEHLMSLATPDDLSITSLKLE